MQVEPIIEPERLPGGSFVLQLLHPESWQDWTMVISFSSLFILIVWRVLMTKPL